MDVLGFTDLQRDTLINDGYSTARTLVHWPYDDIKSWCNNKGKLALNRGGATYGDRKMKNLQALAWWCTDCHLRGLDLDIADGFDIDVMHDAVEESKLDRDELSKSSALEKPGKFSHEKWTTWEESVYNYFTSVRNPRGIPYAYVIRKDDQDHNFMDLDREQQIMFNAPLQGAMFKRNSKYVLRILKELCTDTNAETWIKGIRCGRVAIKALQTHYDGTAEGERRKEVAKNDLKSLFYRNESTFSFEKYVTKMQAFYNTLEQYGEPEYESNKVKNLLDKINCPNNDIKIEVNICRNQHRDNFVQACTYTATAILRIFPNAQPSSTKYRKRREIHAFGQGGGRGRGRGRGRGGRGGRGQGRKPNGKFENGVDISDPCKWFSSDEFSKLSADTRRYIQSHPDRPAAIESRKKARVGSVQTDNDAEQKRHSAALITGVMNAMRQNDTSSRTVQFPTNGSRAASAAASRRQNNPPPQISTEGNDEMSRVTYDHNGNIV